MTARYEAITPDSTPATAQCRALFIPEDERWIAAVTGVLQLLTFPQAWEDANTGGLTPDQAATAWVDFFDKFCLKQGECRMIGEVICYAGSTSPDTRWLLCDGASLLRTDYPDLYAVIGTTYGAADGTHFSIPDLRGRVALSAGAGSGLSSYSLGDVGGEEAHTLTVAETPSHGHSDTGHTHSEGNALPAVGAAIVGVPIPSAVPAVGVTGLGFAGISNTGGDGAHNNLQPFLALNYLIVALP